MKFIVAVILLLGASCTRKPKTPKDQLSYTIGVQFGKSLRGQNLDLDADVLARGITTGLSGEKPRLSEEEMQASIAQLGHDQEQAAKKQADENKVKTGDFLTQNKTAEGVKVTPSGLQYKVLSEGAGPTPKADDQILINYRAKLIDGTEFDSSFKRNAPTEINVSGVVPGWTEGLKLLKKGGKMIFYVPPELGYADHARPPIPNNAVLIFETELLEIKPRPKAR